MLIATNRISCTGNSNLFMNITHKKITQYIKFILVHPRLLKFVSLARASLLIKHIGIENGEETILQEKERVRKIPRYLPETFRTRDIRIKFIDSASFLYMYNEIFEKEIYRFKTRNKEPYIIDCGANIGLSVLYFKQLYPNAIIVAFEPDKNVFRILEENCFYHNLSNVEVINKAVWNTETDLDFFSEGGDAGRIALESDKTRIVQVKTIRLRKYLNKHVDFLKIDIEGSEGKVLKDCREFLKNVDRIFVEYHSFSDQKQNLHELLEILYQAGFRYYIQQIGIFSPNPYIENFPYLNMDNQLNIFAYQNCLK